MNNDRMKRLQQAQAILGKIKEEFDRARELVEEVRDEESDSYDNLTEGLQASERGERMTEVADELSNIAGEMEIDFDDFITRLNECEN